MLLPVREVHIDLPYHSHHHARDILFGILVAVELTLHVAVGALHTQSCRKVAHDAYNLGTVHGGGQNLQVLGGTATAFFTFRSLTTESDHRKRGER